MNRQNSIESQEMLTTEGYILSSSKDRMIFLFNSSILSRRLPFCGRILQFVITVAQVVGEVLVLRSLVTETETESNFRIIRPDWIRFDRIESNRILILRK